MGQINAFFNLLDTLLMAWGDVVGLDVDVVDGVGFILPHVFLANILGIAEGRKREEDRNSLD